MKSEPAPVGEWLAFDPRFRFRSFVHVTDRNSICAHAIDRVVFHKDLAAELARPVDRDFSKGLPPLIAECREAYGPPMFEDSTLIVFRTTDHCARRPASEK